MTPEQMERAIEFLLDHHARFSTQLDGLKEAQARTSRDVADLADTTKDRITSLADALLSLTNIVSEQGDQIAALARQGKDTDARLNALINIVERHITSSNAHPGRE